ncbi:MAG TPA: hypothetical protein PLQ78_09680 [Flavipsychrobacter sp.]|nr:hypothetical protein [Flavipsychrobacter sp.]
MAAIVFIVLAGAFLGAISGMAYSAMLAWWHYRKACIPVSVVAAVLTSWTAFINLGYWLVLLLAILFLIAAVANVCYQKQKAS